MLKALTKQKQSQDKIKHSIYKTFRLELKFYLDVFK